MAQHDEDRPIGDAVELPKMNGVTGLADAVTVLLNSVMVAERSETPISVSRQGHPSNTTRCGRICIGRRKINVSTALAGQTVGVTEVDDQI